MSRDPRLYLEDIRQGCEKVLRYTEGITFAQFKGVAQQSVLTTYSGFI